MSIRKNNKDHLKEHARVELVTPELLTLPNHENPLKFWTHHSTENTLVDLTVFANGDLKPQHKAPFTGRPQLILQLVPAIEAVTVGLTKASVQQINPTLRTWWRLLDTVEQAAAKVGQPMNRVEDVRQLTHVHHDFVVRSKMGKGQFYIGYRILNATLQLLGDPALHWTAPEDSKPKRVLPPNDQIKAIRIALKQEWERVRQRWTVSDQVRADGFEPQTDEEFSLLKHWQHFEQVQGKSGKALPTIDEMRCEMDKYAFNYAGFTLAGIRNIAFPDRWEAETASHLCLAHTGWNPAVLYSLDASQPFNTAQSFLRTHPRDPNRYLLTGTKLKAGGTEQPVSGLWKTTSGPGFIIKMWMERIAPLREQLKTMLSAERSGYTQMLQDGASADLLTHQFEKIQKLEFGCRSVWLFVDGSGNIAWINGTTSTRIWLNDKKVTYMTAFLFRLNRERANRGEAPIAAVGASDFRDMFALFVWQATGGNILAVMRALRHAQLRTTQGYVDNNILNAERDHQARSFLNNLFNELGAGRADITILAHLQRHGEVTKEMEQRLTEYRAKQRSRIGVACKDPLHPPTDIQPSSASTRMCSPQRCLICKPHAVILPESISGIAMRVEELEVMQNTLPVGIWIESRFPEELRNGLDILKLFSSNEVRKAREHWAQAIATGSHYIPGLHLTGNLKETT